MGEIKKEANKFNNSSLFKDEIVDEIRIFSFIKGSEFIIDKIEILRDEIYNKMPTGTNIDSFYLIKIIKNTLDELDELIKMKDEK